MRSRNRLAARHVGAHTIENSHQLLLLGLIDTLERQRECFARERPKLLYQFLAAFGDVQPPSPPIIRIGTPHHQVRILQPVNHPAKGDRLHFQKFSQTALVDPLVALQQGKNLPLRARNAYSPGPFIEPPAQQARHLPQHRPNVVIHAWKLLAMLTIYQHYFDKEYFDAANFP